VSGAVELQQELVRLESTPGREREVVARAVAEMRRLGYDDAYVDEAGNAVGRIGSGGPVVLIDCHLDTIPLHGRELWTHDPLAGEISGDRLYGLGACDMKGSAAASIHGAARLAGRAGGGTVYVVGSIAEEMMEGAALAHTVHACRPDAVVIGEPTDLRLCHGQRGRAKVAVLVRGRSSHAGHPEAGVNAAERMAELIGAVAALEHPVHPRLGRRSITCIDVHSEPYPSVSTVPDRCLARFDCRFGPEEDESSLRALLEAPAAGWEDASVEVGLAPAEFETYVGRRYVVPELAPAWLQPPDAPIVRAALAGLERAGIAPRLTTYRFCTNGSLTAGTLGLPTVGFGVGREADAHAVDESIEVAQLERAVDGFAGLAAALLDAPGGLGWR
jgi:putative selenium metabolism hydrolase